MNKREKQVEELPIVEAHNPPAAFEPDSVIPSPARPANGLRINHDHESLIQIAEAEQQVAAAEARWEESRAEAKECKARWEAAVSELRQTIREANRDYPLFQGQEQPALPSAAPEAKGAAVGDDGEDWRGFGVRALSRHGLSHTLADRLMEAGIATLGQLADWTASGKALTDLSGIGQAKAEQIEQASAAFWQDRAIAAGEPEPDSDDYSDEDEDDPYGEGEEEEIG